MAKASDTGLPEMVRRQAATQATMARYRNKVADWRTGVTCVHLCRYHLKQMGVKVPTMPRIRSEFAAVRELKRRGWRNVADLLDSMLPRIPPAAMVMGDLAVMRSEDGIGSIMVCAGGNRLIGWREDQPKMVTLGIRLDELDGSWRA